MSSQVRVLIVDDDDTIREFVGLALSAEDHQVKGAAHGAEALGVLEDWPADLILLDLRMPVMDGWEFARAYREKQGPHAPIIVLTAARDTADTAAEINAAGYLAKPFDLDDLLQAVDRYRVA